MQDYIGVTSDGDPFVALSNMTREQAAAVAADHGWKISRTAAARNARDVRRITFKLADKRAALVDIGKHLGMFKELHEHSGKDGAPLVPIINLNARRPSG